MWAILLPTKVATVDAIKHVQAIAEKESDLKLQELCTNNGGEFTIIEFNTYCADEGIQRHYSVSYSRATKRRGQTPEPDYGGNCPRPTQAKGHAGRVLVMTTVHLLNRSPIKSLQGRLRMKPDTGAHWQLSTSTHSAALRTSRS
jgi:hypothetical protein